MENQNLSAVRTRKKTVHKYIIFGESSNYNAHDTDRPRMIDFRYFIETVFMKCRALIEFFHGETPCYDFQQQAFGLKGNIF
jgi:hypothetical protein